MSSFRPKCLITPPCCVPLAHAAPLAPSAADHLPICHPARPSGRELTKRVSQFVLRRTADINAKYLPPLALYVVFCRPSPLQLRLYSAVLGSSTVHKMLSTTGADFGDQVRDGGLVGCFACCGAGGEAGARCGGITSTDLGCPGGGGWVIWVGVNSVWD